MTVCGMLQMNFEVPKSTIHDFIKWKYCLYEIKTKTNIESLLTETNIESLLTETNIESLAAYWD